MTIQGSGTNDRELTRELLRRAEGIEAPAVARLVDAVPALLGEARRRRRLDEEPSSRIVSAARAWLPRFAVATALLAVAALVWPGSPRRESAGDDARVLDAWLVTGTASASVSDPALDALLRQGTP